VKWHVSRDSRASARTRRAGASPVSALAERMREARGRGIPLPVVAYYGTGRLWSKQSHTTARRGMQLEDGYRDCLDPRVDFDSFQDWIQALTLDKGLASTRGLPERLLEFLKAVMEIVLRPIGVTAVEYVALQGELMAEVSEMAGAPSGGRESEHAEHVEALWLPVRQLSDGVRTMLGLVGDIVRRIGLLNGDIRELDLREVGGIVLIDEVDLHLHPEWQQQVLPSLRRALPRIQWIVTTHSPQVISTVARECVWVLDHQRLGNGRTHITHPDAQTEGVEAGDVLADVFGVDPLPQTEWRRRINRLMARTDVSDPLTSVEIAELEDHFGSDYYPLRLWRVRPGADGRGRRE
ncbi:MAG: hypothetical protein QG597_3776, partial [Actinomycetota bacterium]|nr:hypothetical protein [Actinomycetota bacterium]